MIRVLARFAQLHLGIFAVRGAHTPIESDAGDALGSWGYLSGLILRARFFAPSCPFLFSAVFYLRQVLASPLDVSVSPLSKSTAAGGRTYLPIIFFTHVRARF